MTSKAFSWINYGFRTFLLGQQLPYLFGIEVTDTCNLNCFYCEGKNKGRYYFNFDQAKQTLQGVQPVIRALKGQNIPAQGNALGTEKVEN